MKNIISDINKNFESRIRLGIMSILIINDWVEFNTFKSVLNVTDGNLASHIKALEKGNYIEVKKQFLGNKPNTSYRITKEGKTAFNLHLDALENFLKNKQ